MKHRAKLNDYLIRGLFIGAGVVAAILFTMKGQAEVLPPLALGALLGAFLVGSADDSSES